MERQNIYKIIGNAEEVLEKLGKIIISFEESKKTPPKQDVQLLKSINRVLGLLEENPFIGNHVPRNLWPKEYETLPNLFRMELSQFWRLLYYVQGNDVIIVSVVFEICDHDKYNDIFGYKKK